VKSEQKERTGGNSLVDYFAGFKNGEILSISQAKKSPEAQTRPGIAVAKGQGFEAFRQTFSEEIE